MLARPKLKIGGRRETKTVCHCWRGLKAQKHLAQGNALGFHGT